jgi:hypothetical protein
MAAMTLAQLGQCALDVLGQVEEQMAALAPADGVTSHASPPWLLLPCAATAKSPNTTPSRLGCITEWTGPPASGKTQCCYWLALHVLQSCPRARVVWIDTTNAFSSERFHSMHVGMACDTPVEMLLERLLHIPCHDVYDVLDALAWLHSPEQPLHLLLLDSITAVLAPILGAGRTSYTLANAVRHHLVSLVRTRWCYAVVVNGCVADGGAWNEGCPPLKSGATSSGDGHLKPALGKQWAAVVDGASIMFARPAWLVGTWCDLILRCLMLSLMT